jgi:serine/threonine-protein kinase
MVGRSLGHYRIETRLGGGGMGEVYRAYDTRLRRRVAIKVLAGVTDDVSRAELLREARAASALNHPNICTIHEVGEADGQAFIVMEYVDGKPLSELIPGGGLPVETLIHYGRQVADALAHAHDHGILHRDLKGRNAMIMPDGRAKLLDFGLAERLESTSPEELTRSGASRDHSGAIAGTWAYMAPEQLRGRPADARSDVWAFGVLLYEMAEGRMPFAGRTEFELTAAILDHPAPAPSSRLPAALRGLIQRCLAKDPSQRYQRASEVRVALETIESEIAGEPRTPAPARARLRLRLLVAALVLAVAVLAIAQLNPDIWRAWRPSAGPPGRITSLAVLPLANLSGDRSREYVVDGITDELITELGRLSALRVISRQSASRFRGSHESLPRIAARLGVEAIVQGSAFQVGERIRISVQLVRAAPEQQLWSASYDRSIGEILSLSSEVAHATAQQVRVTLTDREAAYLARTRPVNAQAYLAYLRGRYAWNQRNRPGVEQAIKEFRQAIALDSGSALAYAGLADCYVVAWDNGWLPPEEAYREARAAATTAVGLDDTIAEAHASLGAVYSFTLLWPAAEREYRRAIELNPGYATAHQWYAINLTTLGRHAEAIEQARRATEIDPLVALRFVFLGQRLYFAGEYDAAGQQLKKALDLDPGFAAAHEQLGRVYVQQRRYADAVREYRRAGATGATAAGSLGHAQALAGDVTAARQQLAALLDEARRTYVPPYQIGLVHLGLGQRDEAIDWFRRAYEEREGVVLDLAVDQRLRPLVADPRFQALLHKSGLAYNAGGAEASPASPRPPRS